MSPKRRGAIMRVTCPACGARYAVDDDAIPPAGRMVQCSACSAEWRATPRSPAAASAASGATARAVAAASGKPAAEGAQVPATLPRQPQPDAMIASLQDAPRRRGGFVAGFAVVALLAFAAVTLYAKQAAIATTAPALAEPLGAYVAAVDRGRLLLAETAARLRRGD